MPSFLSSLNATSIPLSAGSSFIGQDEYIVNFTCGDVSIISDKTTSVSIYGSKDRINWGLIYNGTATAGVPFFDTFIMYHPFLYSEITNTAGTAQTLLNYQLIYRQRPHAIKITEPVVIAGTPSVVIDTRVSSTLWNSASVNAGDNTASFNLSASNHLNLSVYGSSTQPCDITVQFSVDGVNFYSSQYTISLPVAGEFGATIPVSASYVRLKRTDAGANATITAICEAV